MPKHQPRQHHYSLLDDIYIRHLSFAECRALIERWKRLVMRPRRLGRAIVVGVVLLTLIGAAHVWVTKRSRTPLPGLTAQELAGLGYYQRVAAEDDLMLANTYRARTRIVANVASPMLVFFFAYGFCGQRSGLLALTLASRRRTRIVRVAMRSGSPPDESLRAEVNRRHEWWQTHSSSREFTGRFITITTRPVLVWISSACWAALPTTMVAAFFLMSPSEWMWVYAMLPAFALVGMWFTQQILLSRRMRSAFCERLCPMCQYDLSLVPPAFDDDALALAGPKVCPECGSLWPLMPPPVPE